MMAFKRRKKNTRQRGYTTHGWGSMKKHRGAGHRGGRGNAGSGKRGDAKKPSYWKNPSRYGKQGFTERGVLAVQPVTINAGHVSSMAAHLVADGKATEKAGTITIDLAALGYDKLLGSGIVTQKLDLMVGYASAKAIEKVEAAGGKVTVTAAVEEATPADD